MQHMDNHSHPNGAAVSQNADGVWHNLKPALGLWAADVAVPEGQPACVVVQQGQMAWVGPEAQLPAAYQALPRHDARGALATPGWWTATRIWSTAASVPTNSPCAWLVPRTKKWPRRAGALCRRSRPRVRRRKTSFCPGRAAPAGPAGRGRMCHRDQIGLRPGAGARTQAAACGPPSGEVFGVTVCTTFWARTRCRPSMQAAAKPMSI